MIKLSSDKNVELVDLEAHVILCEQRRTAIDDRITRLEEKFSQLEKQERDNRALLVKSLITIASAILSTVIAVFLKYKLI